MEELWLTIKNFFVENEAAWRILLIVVLACIIWWIVRTLISRGVHQVVRGVKKSQMTDSTKEISTVGLVRERAIQRTRTIGAVANSVLTWVVVVVALILILHQVGIDLTAILASAGFIGAALAFGAQSIVKDVLNGIFMVFEDQLGVGDWVSIGNVEGTVEDVGIRVTQVRAIDGTLWFIRNGEILELGNSSQGYGQAIIDITVSTDNDLDAVQEAALAATQNVIESPEYRRKVTGKPEMWGVQSVYGDRVTLRFGVRTRAEAQWALQRAVRKEVNDEFSKRGIVLANQLPDGLLGPQQ